MARMAKGPAERASEIERIIERHARGGGQGLPEQRAPVALSHEGRSELIDVISSIHDDGYALGEAHALGQYEEG